MLHKNMEVKLAWERFSRVNSACTEVFYSHIQNRGEDEENEEIIRIAWPCAVLHSSSRKQRSVNLEKDADGLLAIALPASGGLLAQIGIQRHNKDIL